MNTKRKQLTSSQRTLSAQTSVSRCLGSPTITEHTCRFKYKDVGPSFIAQFLPILIHRQLQSPFLSLPIIIIMTGTNKNVLVFGPTGGIGRIAALEAHKRGAHVWLAMRDTSKTIPGIAEGAEGFTRVSADLSKPETLEDAVKKAGASSAFVYTMFESPDRMKASFEALKSAGITYIVIISSYSVQGSATTEFEDFIPLVHAQTEVALERSGISFTAVRPAYFNTNLLWVKNEFQKGELEILGPDVEFDFIAPENIGTVAGALLVKGEATKPIYLCGPKLYSQKDAHELAAKILGIKLNVKEIGVERWYETHAFFPKPVADAVVSSLTKNATLYPKEVYEEAVNNIRIYGGIEPTRFEDWVESHKAEFT
jgi:uncharacterized protein YbjT (DUF2867 family)